jgi:hypothetical protein
MFKVGNLDLLSNPEEDYHRSTGQKRGKNEKTQDKKYFPRDSTGFGPAICLYVPDPKCRRTGPNRYSKG